MKLTDIQISQYNQGWGYQGGNWNGTCVSLDGSPTEPIDCAGAAEIIRYGVTRTMDWDGKEVVVLRLANGVYAGWETWWGPTGHGFCEDAYGGDTDILFGATAEIVLQHLTESARELLD